MKKQMPMPVIVGIVIVVLLIIAGAGFMVFGGDPSKSPNSPEALRQIQQAHENSAINQHMKSVGAAQPADATPPASDPNSSPYGTQSGKYVPTANGRGAHTNSSMGN